MQLFSCDFHDFFRSYCFVKHLPETTSDRSIDYSGNIKRLFQNGVKRKQGLSLFVWEIENILSLSQIFENLFVWQTGKSKVRSGNSWSCIFQDYLLSVLNLSYLCSSYILILSLRRILSYRNQSIDLQRKWMDWFLYDKDLRHERVKSFW